LPAEAATGSIAILASGSDDNIIPLKGVKAEPRRRAFKGHDRPVYALCALADGRLASSSDGNMRRDSFRRGCGTEARASARAA